MQPPTALLTAAERLAASAGVRAVVEAIGDWVDLGLCDAIAVWRLDRSRDTLRLAGSRQMDTDALEQWRPGPRPSGGLLWGALTRREVLDVRLAELPLALAAAPLSAEDDHWQVAPLLGPDGEEVGVAMAGFRLRPLLPRPWGPAGASLFRAEAHDAALWRAACFERLVALTRDGVIVSTPDGDLMAYNEALETHSGWSADDVRTHGWTILAYPDPEVRRDLHRALAALLRGQPSRGIVRTITRKDGTTAPTSVWSTLVPNPSGDAPAMLGVLRDVSSEQDSARARSRDASLTRLGRLAGGVAHEFNNLLGAIMGHAELLEMSSTDPKVVRRAQTILRASQRGATLSHQLLAFSGTTRMQTRAVLPGPLVEESVELLQGEVPIDIEVAPRLAPVEADVPQLQLALTNVLVNARLSTRTRIRVLVDTVPLPDDVAYRSEEAPPPGTPICRIRVCDDGPGFSPDAMGHLFEPFFSSRQGGHGLGLPAVRGILSTHRGAIDVTNHDGAQVDLYVPFSERPELTVPSSPVGHPEQPIAGRLWLVDDETALVEFGRITLEAQGYAVDSFSSAAELEAFLDTDPPRPDALLVDVVMPETPGPELVRRLRSRGIHAAVLYTSGYSPESAQLDAADGAFLQKPFNGQELAAAVRRLLVNRSR